MAAYALPKAGSGRARIFPFEGKNGALSSGCGSFSGRPLLAASPGAQTQHSQRAKASEAGRGFRNGVYTDLQIVNSPEFIIATLPSGATRKEADRQAAPSVRDVLKQRLRRHVVGGIRPHTGKSNILTKEPLCYWIALWMADIIERIGEHSAAPDGHVKDIRVKPSGTTIPRINNG